jgi:serine/threonine protein kinase
MEGERFGQYVLLERIAIGGMAEIFRAKTFGAAGFQRELVIKRILPSLCDDEQFVKMFIDEATLVAHLHHANIVQIHDFNKVDGSYYLAMEIVDGKDLRKITRAAEKQRAPISIELSLYLTGEALKGLNYAHSRLVDGKPLELVHRDLSPHNLLVSFEGEVKVSDFGIAKARERLAHTVAGIVKGKIGYMSPEQAIGGALDRRSDLFSVGLILYELVTGQRAYPHQAENEMLQKVRRGDIIPPRQHRSDLPADVERLLQRLLAPNPDFRFRSAADALTELSQVRGYSLQSMALGQYTQRLFPEDAKRAASGTRSSHTRLPALTGPVAPAPPKTPAPPSTEPPVSAPATSLQREAAVATAIPTLERELPMALRSVTEQLGNEPAGGPSLASLVLGAPGGGGLGGARGSSSGGGAYASAGSEGEFLASRSGWVGEPPVPTVSGGGPPSSGDSSGRQLPSGRSRALAVDGTSQRYPASQHDAAVPRATFVPEGGGRRGGGRVARAGDLLGRDEGASWLRWPLALGVAVCVALGTGSAVQRLRAPGASSPQAPRTSTNADGQGATSGALEPGAGKGAAPQIVQLLPAQRRPTRGRLRVSTTPAAARVFVDRVQVKRAAPGRPVRIDGEPGARATLRVELEGYEAVERQVVFPQREDELSVELIKEPR